MDLTRISELLQPFLSASPSAHQLEQISIYIDLLLRWNSRVNLTAIRTPEEIVTRHFGESFFAARHLLPADEERSSVSHALTETIDAPDKTALTSAQTETQTPPKAKLQTNLKTELQATPKKVVDLGSGAGFPGLPLKIWSPATPITLIESNHKKVAFLREVIRALTLTAIDVFPGRAEDYPAASAQLVTLRAVERFADILPIAARLVTPAGRLALLIGEPQIPQAQALLPALRWQPSLPIPLSSSRVLLNTDVPR
jgi:16S rRNA (guanine527-N7)-methyltransferase